jgi:hypothetical protein
MRILKHNVRFDFIVQYIFLVTKTFSALYIVLFCIRKSEKSLYGWYTHAHFGSWQGTACGIFPIFLCLHFAREIFLKIFTVFFLVAHFNMLVG